MAIEFGDGDLITSFVHGSRRITIKTNSFDSQLVNQTLSEIGGKQEPDDCQIAISRCRREPHPVFEGRFVLSGTDLFRLNIFYHPLGEFFIERRVLYPEGEDSLYSPIDYYPCHEGPRQFMIRRWMGQNYGRIPVECLVDLSTACSIVSHFVTGHGQACTDIRWLNQSEMNWQFYLGPEDDWPNPVEHIRPACQVPLPELETLRQLGRVFSDFF